MTLATMIFVALIFENFIAVIRSLSIQRALVHSDAQLAMRFITKWQYLQPPEKKLWPQ